MKLQVNNFGPVKGKQDYQIDLTKQFTLVTGANGLGKTYLSYLVYGVMKNYDQLTKVLVELHEKYIKEITVDNGFHFQVSYEVFEDVICMPIIKFKENIYSHLGIDKIRGEQIFDDFELNVSDYEKFYSAFLKRSVDYEIKYKDDTLRFVKKENEATLSIIPDNVINSNISFITSSLIDAYFYFSILDAISSITSRVTYIPVERNSIYTFIKELSLKRSELVSKMQELFLSKDKDDNALPDVLKKSSNRYPEAIEDVMRDAQDLSQISKEEGDKKYVQLAHEIEEDILGGKVSVNSEGEVEFSPERSKKANIPVHMSASFIKTISSLIFFLKHKAKKGDLLMIDEPEMNLHPNMLIKLTRIFAKMCNAGIKLWISTHSDYIISEINNLIMVDILNKKELKEETEKWGYQTNEYIDKEQMQVLYLNGQIAKTQVKIQNLPITDMGINIKSIDTTLDDLNERTNELTELYYNLEEE